MSDELPPDEDTLTDLLVCVDRMADEGTLARAIDRTRRRLTMLEAMRDALKPGRRQVRRPVITDPPSSTTTRGFDRGPDGYHLTARGRAEALPAKEDDE